MSTVAAISISDKEALVVTGDQDKDGVIQLISITSRTLTGTHSSPERTGEQGTNGMAAQTSGAEVSSSAEAAFIMKETATSSSSTLIDLGVDSIVALAPAIKVLYKKSFLPFSDQKKLDQVLPLQIQDALPFDVGEFVVANVVLAKNGNNNYEILSSIAPRSDIERTLRIMSALGAEPHILTTRASMLASLASISREPLGSTYVLIALSEEYCSIALFVEDHLCQLRDLPIPDQPGTGETANGELLAMIKSSVIAAEHEFSIRFPVVYLIGNREAAHVLSEVLFIPVKLFPIERAVRDQTGEHLDFSAIFWAVGAIASENSKAKTPRKGRLIFAKVFSPISRLGAIYGSHFVTSCCQFVLRCSFSSAGPWPWSIIQINP
ncbi:MAG TPA: hypothetical protein PLP17_10210 [Oligoflexia bacterium]|nr:hypothetical protein [Oligoflexia bacterium]